METMTFTCISSHLVVNNNPTRQVPSLSRFTDKEIEDRDVKRFARGHAAGKKHMEMELESWSPNPWCSALLRLLAPDFWEKDYGREARRVNQHRSFHWSRMTLPVINAGVLMTLPVINAGVLTTEPRNEADPFLARAGSFLKGLGSFLCE